MKKLEILCYQNVTDTQGEQTLLEKWHHWAAQSKVVTKVQFVKKNLQYLQSAIKWGMSV